MSSGKASIRPASTISQISEELDSVTVGHYGESTQSEPEDLKNSSFGSGLLHLLPNKSKHSEYSGREGEDNSPVSSSTSSLSSPTGRQLHSTRSICFQGIDSGYGETGESESSRPVSGISMVETWQQEDKYRNEPPRKLCYETIKPLAVKAMQQQPDASKLRVPNPLWSGFGFSHSTPGSILKTCAMQAQLESVQDIDDQAWGEQAFGPLAYNICHAPVQSPSKTMDAVVGSIALKELKNDVILLLESLGLERFAYIFISEEIDMDTFMTLDDNDLRELGVSTYIARMKILRAITELRKGYFIDAVALGAENKAETSSHWNRYGF